MKTPKLFLISILVLFCVQTNGTVRTVNNNNPTPGQYNNYITAYNLAVAGDTIYISGSPLSYSAGGTPLAKQLTIIGTGHNPDKQNPVVSSFFYIDIQSGGTGSRIIGITFTSLSYVLQTATINYESCKFQFSSFDIQTGVSPVTLNFKKCVFGPSAAISGSLFSGTSTINYNNCIFNASLNNFSGTATQTGSVTNCLFLGNATASIGANFNTFSFTNNIFYGTSPQITGTNTATTMTKNISFNCPNNNFNGTTLSGNIVNSNPLFTIYGAPVGFKYTDNYNLQAASPGHLTGTDGKDIGLYGGTDGINFHMGGDPAIPQIRQMNVTNTTVPAGTPVNVNIISTRKQ